MSNLHLIQEIHNSLPLLILTPTQPFHPMRIGLLRKYLPGREHIAKCDDASLNLGLGGRWRRGCRRSPMRRGLGARCGWSWMLLFRLWVERVAFECWRGCWVRLVRGELDIERC